MPFKKKIVSESLSVAENVPTVVEQVKEKPFLFSYTEIEDFSDLFRDVVLMKKEKKDLPRGAPRRIWKLAVAAKVAQKEPFVLKYNITTETCPLCGHESAWSAHCSWNDRYYENGVRKERMYVLNGVCPDCLEGSCAVYMYLSEWLEIIANNRDKAQYASIGNAKDVNCQICKSHFSDSTWVHIPWGSKMLKVAMCISCFDNIVGYVKNVSPDEVAKQIFPKELYAQMNVYHPKRNEKREKKLKEEVVLKENIFDEID